MSNVCNSMIYLSAFHQAVENGDLQAVMEYVESGMDINKENKYGENAVYIANMYGQWSILNYLRDHGGK